MERYQADKSILGNLTMSRINEVMRGDYARGLMLMFIRMSPWQTFGTLTVKPEYGNRLEEDQGGMSPEGMKRVMMKMFSRRKLRSMKFFWVLERHLPAIYGGKGGTHAHFITQNEPEDLSWKKCWKWWHETKGYGRFRTDKVNYDLFTRMSVYLAKYAGKDALHSDWGFQRFGPSPPLELVGQRVPGEPSVQVNSKEYWKAARETMDWGRKAHAGNRPVYRPVKKMVEKTNWPTVWPETEKEWTEV